MFGKILVANRGEVAVRIIRACKDLGISTVAVYSDADRNSLHVRYADEAFNVGPAPARQSYLRADRIIESARQAGAEAIHPGYGFLAESAGFSRACHEVGIVFIGPPPAVIEAMGNKLVARRTMQGAGVRVVPGIYDRVRDQSHALETAADIGYPVLIKASAGGGGKGMRIVNNAEEMAGSLREAEAEALSAFGDSTIYMEKLLHHVRHIEVQVLADRFGNVIHLGERECSIQRRHQKLIEEAPSPLADGKMRQRMGEVAVKAAKAVGYEGAGTVEFLVDSNKDFYFLEMNTRLQVEHAVTEMVTGVDIVAEQLRVSAGEQLRHKQEGVAPKGWSLECRITSEDPFTGFMPSAGKITILHEPGGPGVRVDSSLFPGLEVGLHYDPLIARLIVWGENREQAMQRMRRALREYRIAGIQTSMPFHLAVMDNDNFAEGRFDTSFVEQHDLLGRNGHESSRQLAAVMASLVAHTAGDNGEKKPVYCKPNGVSPWKLAARREALRPR